MREVSRSGGGIKLPFKLDIQVQESPMTSISSEERPGRDRPILLVEGNPQALEILRSKVEEDGFQVETVQSALEATEKALRTPYSALMINTELPDGSGFSVAAELRRVDTRTPILFLSGAGSREAMLYVETKKNAGSGVGFDDLTILSERILMLVDGGDSRPTVVVRCEPLEMNRVRREVRCKGKRLPLTQIEFRILEELMLKANRKVAPQDLLQAVWGEPRTRNSNVLAVHIRNLRKKLEDRGCEGLLETVCGEGYVLRDPADSEEVPALS
jgi:two-component system copper resistance phosphate regulon response regulator CusR